MIRRPPRSTLFPYTTALPISPRVGAPDIVRPLDARAQVADHRVEPDVDALRLLRIAVDRDGDAPVDVARHRDRKSTRLNSSHSQISYAVFCLKKKKTTIEILI